MIFDAKPLNGNALQQAYDDAQGQGQPEWQQDMEMVRSFGGLNTNNTSLHNASFFRFGLVLYHCFRSVNRFPLCKQYNILVIQ